jgi:hypothetical protein
MITRLPLPIHLIDSIKKYLTTHNLGNRGVEDGNTRKQEVGLIGELMVHYFLYGQYPNLSEKKDGFDGGFDLIWKGYRIDVKTMERKSFVRPEYVNNFYLMQEIFPADIVVFCSLNKVYNQLEICGWIPKTELGIRGKYYAAGSKRIRSDGSFFFFRQNNYEVENKDLNPIESLVHITQHIE